MSDLDDLAPGLAAATRRVQDRLDAMGEKGSNRPLYAGTALTYDKAKALAENCAREALVRLAEHHDVLKVIGAACEYTLIVGLYARDAEATA